MDELRESYDQLMEAYNFIKTEVRRRDKHLYERWKAGGFLIDDDIISMFPALSKVMEFLEEDTEEEDGGE